MGEFITILNYASLPFWFFFGAKMAYVENGFLKLSACLILYICFVIGLIFIEQMGK